MSRRFSLLAILLPAVLLLALLPQTASAQRDMAVDLTQREVAVTTGFHGTELVIFGAIEGGGDVIVTVRGPEREVKVRQKNRVAGIWLNTDSMIFADVPGYYAVFATKPVDQILPPDKQAIEQIGVDGLGVVALDPGDEDPTEFRQALIRERQFQRLFPPVAGPISFEGGKLFRATLELPANVPLGAYQVTAYLCRNQVVVASQSIPLNIFKAGLEARINGYAERHPLLYGLIAVAASAMAGYAGTLLFRSS